jgi:AraC-like DNA-binding protein
VKNPSKLYKEIAYSLGYARGDHFARQFKKHTGMLPGEYRKKFGKK